MPSKRRSATEPVTDEVVVEATLIEEEIAPQAPLTDEEKKVAAVVAHSPEQEETFVSEKVMTNEQRRQEVSFILAGIRASKDALLKEAEAKVTAIQNQLAASLREYDELYATYSKELAELRKGGA